MFEMLREVKGCRALAFRGHELDGVLALKPPRFHPVHQTETLEWKIAVRKQGLTDLVTGKLILFQNEHLPALLGQHGGRGRPGGPASNNDDVVVQAHVYLTFLCCGKKNSCNSSSTFNRLSRARTISSSRTLK